MGIQIDLPKIKPVLAKVDPVQFLMMLLEEVKQLLTVGIDLDVISEEDLIGLVALRKSFREKILKLVKEGSRNGSC